MYRRTSVVRCDVRVWCGVQVAHMTSSPMELFDIAMIGPTLLAVNIYFKCVINEYILLGVCFVSELIAFCYVLVHSIITHDKCSRRN